MKIDLLPAQVQAIELASIAAWLATNLALAEHSDAENYLVSAMMDAAEAQAAINIIVATLTKAHAEELAEAVA